MKENRELICTEEGVGERVDPFPSMCEEQPSVRQTVGAPQVRPGGHWFAGLAVGVAVFAAAFLLCESFYALRARTEEAILLSGGQAGALMTDSSEQMSGVISGGTDAEGRPEATTEVRAPVTVLGAGSESTDTTSTTAAEAPAVPLLTSEELYAHDAESTPQGMIPIVPMDLSLIGYGEAFHYNDTPYQPNLTDSALAQGAIPAAASVGEVSVLILHTHATEGYSEEGATYYDPATPLARAESESEGVIAVGQRIADILNRNGIVTVHSTVIHDRESYRDSYSRSAQTIQSYLAQYPSIRLVIDVHRDSIMTSGDRLVRPVTVVNGEAVAQVMCVVGSNASGAAYDGWERNLSLAVTLRNALNQAHGNLCRPIYIKKSAYNQQYAPASLLLEIGSSGNSQAEAERAAVLVAEMIVGLMGR